MSPDATVAAAVELMQATGISQLPVLRDGLPVGSILEVTVARILHDGGDPAAICVQEVMARPLPQLESAPSSTRPTACFWPGIPVFWLSRMGRFSTSSRGSTWCTTGTSAQAINEAEERRLLMQIDA